MAHATFAEILLAGVLATAMTCAAPASVSDLGPTPALLAIRQDFPVLLAALLENTHEKPMIDWVVAHDGDAVAMWHAGRNRGLVLLSFEIVATRRRPRF